ncbi:tetratricopeptide repeat protein [Flavobacterium macacae]|uniref:HTH araC/xylS-type domain-containing protein n=1 Tax=Flavobacterium macacae TaxID=2488993 RepID=A0A3P3W0B4_9FLAO|nr:tetratricopeptide repeat protein [Flavobacterium macacae]RRJ88491.1 hypothetical protein EG849_14525 [Flavobacterium macacae]
MKKIVLALLLMAGMGSFAQVAQKKTQDSLDGKNYAYFAAAVRSAKGDTVILQAYRKAWLAKARQENNWNQVAAAYSMVMTQDSRQKLPFYADSLLEASRRSGDERLIGNAYMKKGIVHYEKKQHQKALDNYLLADRYIARSGDAYAVHKLKYALAQVKYYLGLYEEAIALLEQCMKYFENENDRAYLNSMHSIGLCYARVGNSARSSEMNRLGLQLGMEFEIDEMAPYFTLSEGINAFDRGDYSASEKKMAAALPFLQENKDFANETVACFYLGMGKFKEGKTEESMAYFRKVDDAFSKHGYTRPDLRMAHEKLIGYYKEKGEPQRYLAAMERLLQVDSVLNHEYRYLSGKIFKQYDTPMLLAGTEEVRRAMALRYEVQCAAIGLLLLLALYLAARHYRVQQKYRQKFKEMIEKRAEAAMAPAVIRHQEEQGHEISDEMVQAVLEHLRKFEETKKFLEKGMNLGGMSKIFKANSKYVAMIILKYRGKKSIEYIYALKLDYIVEMLHSDKKFRKYTHEGLGQAAGFGSTQSFTKAFKERYGMSPAFFCSELKKTHPLE